MEPTACPDCFNPEHTCPHSLLPFSPSSSFHGHTLPCSLCIHLLFYSLRTVPSKQCLSLQRTAANRKIRILKSSRLSHPITSVCHSVLPTSVISRVRAYSWVCIYLRQSPVCHFCFPHWTWMERKHPGTICVLTRLLLFALGRRVLYLTNVFKLFVSHLKGLLRRFVKRKARTSMRAAFTHEAQVWSHEDLWMLDNQWLLPPGWMCNKELLGGTNSPWEEVDRKQKKWRCRVSWRQTKSET